MPKGLVLGAILALIVLIGVMTWLNKRSLDQGNAPQAQAAPQATVPAGPKAAAPAATVAPASAQGPVVLTAIAPAWIQVTDQGKTLFEGMLQPGQTYAVPPTAAAPMLKAGKPEALNVTVGGVAAPAVGPPGKVSKVSLTPSALMKGPAARTSAPVARAAPPAQAPAETNSAE
jgi:cytoskeleton protein RodZ